MAWAKVDDRLHSHYKWRRTSKGGRALWATALSWCSSFPSDGIVPKDLLSYLDGTPSEAKSLVASGLWTPHPDGWQFHEWDERNPDSVSIRAGTDAKRTGGQQGSHRRWHVGRGVKVAECQWCEDEDGIGT